MADAVLKFLEDEGGSSPDATPHDSTLAFLESGGTSLPETQKRGDFSPPATPQAKIILGDAAPGAEVIKHVASSLGANLVAGGRGMYDLATHQDIGYAHDRADALVKKLTYDVAPGSQADKMVHAMDSNWNPLNWAGVGLKYAGKGVQAGLDAAGVPSQYSTIAGAGAEAAGNVALGTYGAAKALGMGKAGVAGEPSPGVAPEAPPQAPLTSSGAPRAPYADIPQEIGKTPSGTSIPAAPSTLTATGAPRSAFWEAPEPSAKPVAVVDSEPVAGGLPKQFGAERAQILDRVGLEHARDSALSGDAKAAATDYQLSRFDEPAGQAAKSQFMAERQALETHAANIVQDTKGSLGLDEDTLHTRGSTVAAPFDSLRDWFKDQRNELYKAADERSGGHPVVQPLSMEEMLGDKSFNNQMTARGQTHLVNGIKSELDRFKETNGGAALTVKQAEQFRQFLNTLWSPENSSTIGRLKGALDDDVLKGAGEDLYGPARKLAQVEKQTLDNPNGITKLFDVDPQNPINRSTAIEKIPDTLNRLSADQFSNVVKTLQTMPEQLQPAAQAAMAEIKAHLVNKVMEAGSKTQGQWNAPGVSSYLQKNARKFQIAFEDQPEVLAKIQDLDSAGRILRVDAAYPGAAAQAANAMKRGFMSHAISKVSAVAGAGAGSVLGPLGAAGGAAAGEALGSRFGAGMAEKSALRAWQNQTTNIGDLLRDNSVSPRR